MPPFTGKPKGMFKAGKAGGSKGGASEWNKKSSADSTVESLTGGSMRQYMEDIEYHSTLADKVRRLACSPGGAGVCM